VKEVRSRERGGRDKVPQSEVLVGGRFKRSRANVGERADNKRRVRKWRKGKERRNNDS
jgi:hypothetical protein